MKQEFEIVSNKRSGAELTKKLTAEQTEGSSLVVMARDIPTETAYYDVLVKFDSNGKLLAIKLNFSRGMI